MKKKILLFTIILIANFNIYAQSNSTISGQVINKETKEIIPFATIAIMSNNDDDSGGCGELKNG